MAMILPLLLVILLAALFAWLATRAWRARSALVRWPGLALSGLLALALAVVAVVGLIGIYRLNVAPYRYTVSDVQVAMTPENIARGEKLAHICIDCHSSTGDLPLDGSAFDFLADPSAPPVGSLWGPNLTSGGRLKDWSDGEILRALREGVGKDGRPLVIMTSQAFKYMSDEDAQALVAYLRSQPAVERDLPRRDLNLLGAIFFGAGLFPTSAQEPITAPVVAPAPGSEAYGEYLVYATGCRDCHGENLDGVVQNGPPGLSAPNLLTSMPAWEEAKFLALFRSGKLPNGRGVDPMVMPWKSYGETFTDQDLKDIYNYLHGLPALGVTE